jgi:RimJ/RimL family protein N-acetyltransferase
MSEQIPESTPQPSLPAAIQLRDVTEADLPIFFEHQLDPEANYMAAFTAKEPTNREAFMAHWAKILNDDGILIKTILYQGQVAGYVSTHGWFGELEITYWLGKAYWGQGLATQALAAFLQVQPSRPLVGRAAKDNVASIRVLQKCGFVLTGEDRGFANARGEEIDEVILTLA